MWLKFNICSSWILTTIFFIVVVVVIIIISFIIIKVIEYLEHWIFMWLNFYVLPGS